MAEMGSSEANLFSAALSALIEWFTTALLPKYSALSQAQAGTWTAKLGGRGKQCRYSALFMQQSRFQPIETRWVRTVLSDFRIRRPKDALPSEWFSTTRRVFCVLIRYLNEQRGAREGMKLAGRLHSCSIVHF